MRNRWSSGLVILAAAICLLANTVQGAESRKLKKSVKPAYPSLALQMKVEGTVKLEAVVSKDGTVNNVIVVSGHALLKPAAVDCVKQWQYEPGTETTLVPVEVTFKLAS